jgi:hypothetical protein
VTNSARWLALPLLIGALVSLTVGLLAREEAIAPGSYPGGYFRLFFSDSLHLKVWFATAAVVLGLSQLFSAAWIFGKLPWRRPAGVPAVHRWVGRLAFACTLPAAYHCIFKLGFQRTDTRVLAHSLLSCAFPDLACQSPAPAKAATTRPVKSGGFQSLISPHTSGSASTRSS